MKVDTTYLEYLANFENFSWSRWGDGEWNAIKEKHGQNCDKHFYFPDLGSALRDVLESKPDYNISLQNLALTQNKGVEIFERLTAFNEWAPVNEYLVRLSLKNKLGPFFDVLKKRDVIIVGNEKVCNIKQIKCEKIIIPSVNCWYAYLEILQKIKSAIKKDVVILYAASMMANVLIDNVYNIHKENITQIDVGSVLDPYVGINSRTYHKKVIGC